jgi:hypothetical protein
MTLAPRVADIKDVNVEKEDCSSAEYSVLTGGLKHKIASWELLFAGVDRLLVVAVGELPVQSAIQSRSTVQMVSMAVQL